MGKISFHLVRILSLFALISLAACGGSGDSPDSPPSAPTPSATAQTTVGYITGFGSVYVNGVEYETAGTSYEVDDRSGSSDADLAVGMVVKIQGSVNPDGRSGTADSVSYDDDIEGLVEGLMADPMDANVKTFSIMSVSIRANRNSTNFEGEDDPGFSFETIMNDDNVEVSGEYDGDILIATYIEKQDALDDDFEAKGTVSMYSGDTFVLILANESTLNVTVASGAEIPSAGIMDGQYVEVEGTIPDPVGAPTSMLASKVELEDDDRLDDSDDAEVELKGVLGYDMDTSSWSVRDVTLAFDEGTEYSPESLQESIADLSAAGLYVEVEGQYDGDVLQVEEIELEEDELEFKANVSEIVSTDPRDGTLTLTFGLATGMLDVKVTPDTMFRDDDAVENFDLGDIMADDKVEIEARMGDDGMIYASSLHVEDDMGYEIKGPVDSISDMAITVLGIAFVIDANTFFENGDPVADDYVEVEDDDGNGIADSVEIED